MYRQGDIGCYWYVVLAGALEVRASKTGKYEVRRLTRVKMIKLHATFSLMEVYLYARTDL